MQDVRKVQPNKEVLEGHGGVRTRGPRSASLASTDPASAHSLSGVAAVADRQGAPRRGAGPQTESAIWLLAAGAPAFRIPVQDRPRGGRGRRPRRAEPPCTATEEIGTLLGEATDDMDKLLGRQRRPPRRRSRRPAAGRSIASSSARWTRSASPRGRGHRQAVRRWSPPRRAKCRPLLLEKPDLPPPRRAHQPPGRRERQLARGAPQGIPGRRARRHPRSLLPRRRRGMDPRARSRQGFPVQGQLLRLARAEEEAPRARAEAGDRLPEDPRARARVGAHGPRARGRPRSSKARLTAYETLYAEDQAKKAPEGTEIHIPSVARASATSWSRPRTSRRPTAIASSSTTSISRSRAAASSA